MAKAPGRKRKRYLEIRGLGQKEALNLTRMRAGQRAAALGKVHRGVMAPPALARGHSRLRSRISYLRGGGIQKVYLRLTKSGAFRRDRVVVMKDIDTAIRQAGHKIESMTGEIRREMEAQAEINETHFSTYENWDGMGAQERRAALKGILATTDRLQKRYKRSRDLGLGEIEEIDRHPLEREEKEAAVKRLHKALELLRKKNKGAAYASMVGASNSLIAQVIVLRDQRSATTRDKSVLEKERGRRDTIIRGYKNQLYPGKGLFSLNTWGQKRLLSFAGNQLKFFAENIGEISERRAWLNNLQKLLRGRISSPALMELDMARRMAHSNPAGAKQTLLGIAEALEKEIGRIKAGGK